MTETQAWEPQGVGTRSARRWSWASPVTERALGCPHVFSPQGGPCWRRHTHLVYGTVYSRPTFPVPLDGQDYTDYFPKLVAKTNVPLLGG